MSFRSHHIGITVDDIDDMTSFYTETFDFDVIDRFSLDSAAFERAVDVPNARARFVHLDAADLVVELIEYSPPGLTHVSDGLDHPGTTHVGLKVDDVDEVYANLPADVETISEPQTSSSGTRFLFFRDPEGNLIEVLAPGND